MLLKLTLYNIPVTPSTNSKFAILLPIILPIIASDAGGVSNNAADKETISSGAEVPNATTVKPINTCEKLNFLAIASA